MEPQTPMTNKIVTVSVLIEPGGFIIQNAFLDGAEIEFRGYVYVGTCFSKHAKLNK